MVTNWIKISYWIVDGWNYPQQEEIVEEMLIQFNKVLFEVWVEYFCYRQWVRMTIEAFPNTPPPLLESVTRCFPVANHNACNGFCSVS